ncbi:MAG: hypothetical protein SPJ69_07855 [Campylobacter sp.]|uniref:hypothetical protein n=1 Tax=Campylobacter sp. TaxID=205 RepID=UPI002977AB66|nr:hypothetical protein [Campylobacter sp.]MDD7599492.1 hypothetical protein [Campylobacteraceae bacterium]MDY5888217.1 hypothetical protein [Campylobacter sp.]
MIKYSFENRLNIFRQIVDTKKFQDFFFQPKNTALKILEFIPNSDILELCEYMAKEKKNYTISHNQDYGNRTQNDKIKDSFSGILAETCINILLSKISLIKDSYIKQFDLERTSWEYPKQNGEKEYDIKIVSHFNEAKYINIEVKSSSCDGNIENVYNRYHLYGGHINNINELTEIMDYYFQVMIWKTNKNTFVTKENIENGSVKIYLMGAISARDLYLNGFVGHHTINEKSLNDNERVAKFINECKNELVNADFDEIMRIIKANEKILKNPLYIQIALNKTKNVNEICREIRYAFLGLNSGLLSQMLLKNQL